MKKLLLAIAIMIFVSCEKPEPTTPTKPQPKTWNCTIKSTIETRLGNNCVWSTGYKPQDQITYTYTSFYGTSSEKSAFEQKVKEQKTWGDLTCIYYYEYKTCNCQ